MRQLLTLDSERHPAVNAALDTTINAMREAAEPHDKLSVVCNGTATDASSPFHLGRQCASG
jgi:hypothetical protein